ncbi:hypothetical protein N9967_02445 [bacterium]|nr:hypothetical protein [bacterium]
MEGDVVNQWVDAEELRKLAESLMVSAPRVNQSAPEAVYGDSFVGYTEVAAVPPCETGSPGRDAALRTLSEARGLAASAGIVYRQPASVEDLSAENVEAEEVQLEPVASRASDEMAAAEPAPQKFYKKVVTPFKITTQPMSQPTPQDAIVPAGPFGARSAASQQEASQVQVIASSLSPSGQPLSRRMVVFGDWLKASVPAEAFFVCDRNGEIISDEIGNRLPLFGQYQDAMWTDSPWLYHARLSAALNLKLLDPRVVCEAALEAREKGTAPLAAVEGFVRQILGWREYVRGLYWLKMPDYLEMNALDANEDLPKFFWTGKTEFTCLSDSLGQTLKYGYAHHIQRLMVTGLFSMMYGVNPKQIHEWYLAVYVDAVEWVELPNVTGMSQWADGGIMASKPYAATGKYIQRMSNYCKECPRNPAKRSGPDACPFTTLYWDFLLQHREKLSKNQRMSLQLRNLNRLSDDDITEIQTAALDLRKSLK